MFFIYIGLLLQGEVLFQLSTLKLTGILVTLGLISRILSGYVYFDKSSDTKLNKLLIGLGMTPIGEAGLIFATFGKNMGIIDEKSLASIVASVVIISIITPILIKWTIFYRNSTA